MDSKELLTYLNFTLNYYKIFLSLTKGQKEILSSGNAYNISKLIEKKDLLLDKIKALDLRFNPSQKNVNNLVLKKNNEINDLINRLKKMITSIIKLEDESRELFSELKDNVRDNLHNIQKRKQMFTTYTSSKEKKAFFIDTKR